MAKKDVVFIFWNETWSDTVGRKFMPNDRFSQTLLLDERVNKLVFANDYRSGPTQFLRRLMGRPNNALPARDGLSLFAPLRLRRRNAIGEAHLRRGYEAYDRRLRRHVAEQGLHNPVVITSNPFQAAHSPMNWAASVTYYAWDDWAALPALKRWWPDLERAYERIREQGRGVCAVSQTLLDRINTSGPSALIPNGIEPSEWQPPWSVPEWADPLPSPNVLYIGAIQGRIDTDAIREIAERLTHVQVFVVGPVLDRAVVRSLHGLPNLHVKPPLSRAEVAGLVHSADLCIMPHRRTPLTLSMSPLKIYEYCGAGRPVVATDLPPVRDIHPKVHLVGEGESFSAAVERALAEGPMPESERQAFLEQHSWARRHDQIIDFALGA